MLFSSISFLYYFLPCVLLVYFSAPKKAKNAVLLIFSLVFYAWGEPKYVFLMLATILLNYILGILVDKYRGKWQSRLFLWTAVAVSIGLLGYFKYADFFVENFNKMTGLSVKMLNIALPIGISFYTFQILSYVIDVYRGNVAVQRSLVSLATYVVLFPQLIAGPIVRYIDVEKELKDRTHSFEKSVYGIERFITGLSKKVILANTFGEICSAFQSANEKSVLFYWLYAISYMLQVYFDFSGYSDMAIGLGKIFGFNFLENFNYPFISRSVTEFWRRWHISLGSWFRDYVYIPLGGNRVGKSRHFFNILIVWLLTGFWHGAEWNFVVWGLYFAILLIAEKLFLGKYIAKSKLIGHIYLLFLTVISFVIFGANTMSEALLTIKGLFGAGGVPLCSSISVYYLRSNIVVLLIGALAATPIPKLALARICQSKTAKKAWSLIEIPILILLLIVCTAFLADGTFNPFLYFRF